MRRIAIIGGGFSGVLTAVHLLRHPAVRVTIIERTGRFGPGKAYATPAPVHFLNVPAGNMSAFDDDPGHFLRWAQARDPSVSTGSFLPRGVYGAYLEHVLAAAQSASGGRLCLIGGEAVGVEAASTDALGVRLNTGAAIDADRVVLAFGNSLPPPLPGLSPEMAEHPAYVSDPWSAGAFDRVRSDDPVLIVGTGLTMLDAVMSLHAADHKGRIVAISRHGLLPRPHRSPSRPPVHRPAPEALASWRGSAGRLLHILRRAIEDNATRGTDWRDVVTSVRPLTAQLWARMPEHEQRRFLERLRSYWDVVRHRAAPETAAVINDLIAARRLIVRAGRVQSIRPAAHRPGWIDAEFRPRGSSNAQGLRVACVLNCLGPDTDVHRTKDPLISQLVASGEISPDVHALGLQTTETGAAVRADGKSSETLFVIGPCRRANLWESTAVPELRRHAATLAAVLTK